VSDDYIIDPETYGGIEVALVPLTFGRARIVVSNTPGSDWVDDSW
jgi:hypothetical protein